MGTKLKRKPVWRDTSCTFKVARLDWLKQIMEIRDDDIDRYQLVEELLALAEPLIDMTTGYPVANAQAIISGILNHKEAAARVATPNMVLNPNPTLLVQFVTPEEWENDDLLFQKMDKMHFMCWAGSLDCETMHVNPNIVNFTGVPASEFQGRRWLEQIHPDDRAAALHAFQEGFASRSYFRYPYRFRRADNKYDYIMDYVQGRRHHKGAWLGFVGTMHVVPPPGSPMESLTWADNQWLSRVG